MVIEEISEEYKSSPNIDSRAERNKNASDRELLSSNNEQPVLYSTNNYMEGGSSLISDSSISASEMSSDTSSLLSSADVKSFKY